MKTATRSAIGRSGWLVAVLTGFAFGQTGAPPAGKPAAGGASSAGLPAGDIQKLVAPIALYPDVLVSQILPAATFPTDIVMASRWCRDHPDLKGLDQQKWDLSVLSVCRYPTLLKKMDDDLDWTNALGAAFVSQPQDVMAAIQTLRHQAQAAGVLQTNSQQTVVIDQQSIRIVPTEKEVVYVPQYNPQVIYVEKDDDDVSVAAAATAAAISFGAGLALGAWLDNDCDWHHGVVVGCRPGYWGGWGYRGAVAWDDDWMAARGPRRGVVAGEHGGAYVGPRGAAVWGENGHGAAWRRPYGSPAPAYTGRYSNYANVSGYHRNVAAGNEVNINRNNVNIDRGDRTYMRGGDTTAVRGGDRTAAGYRQDNSTFNDRRGADEINRESSRGQQSRDYSAQRSQYQDAAGDRSYRSADRDTQGAFSQRGSGNDVRRDSSRGSYSRQSSGRGGGGRRGGRR